MQYGILRCQNKKINGTKLEIEFSLNKYNTETFRLQDACAAPCTHQEELLWGLIPIQLNEILGIMLSHYLLEKIK